MGSLYNNDGERYFAASNTKDGFVSYFDTVFEKKECERVYVIKGGPGVGKSTFMKRLDKLCTDKGCHTELFQCSSDPESLDGIIIKEKKIAVVDGTKPHAIEPELAGAREIIIDLGKAWDTDMLFDKKEEIETLSDTKKRLYADCYKCLYTKGMMDGLIYNLIFPYILFDKLDKSASRLAKSIFKAEKTSGEQKIKTRITKAFSSLGKVRLFTFENMADLCIFIKEPYKESRIPHHYLGCIYEYAKNSGADIYVSYNPEKKDEIDALYFPKQKVSISAYDRDYVAFCDRNLKRCKIINGARFVDVKAFSHQKPLYKFYARLSENMEAAALESLKNAGITHMNIEKIYRQCTNYKTVEKITNDYIKMMLQ